MKLALTLLLFCAQSFASDYLVQLPQGCTVSGKTQLSGSCDAAVPVPTVTSFPAYVNSAGGLFTHWAGKYQLDFCNSGCTSPAAIDVSKLDEIFGPSWPGKIAGEIVFLKLLVKNYFSAQFTVPTGLLKTGMYGGYKNGETNNQALYSMTISTTGGDFSNPSLPGSTVVPGCYKNKTAGVPMQWNADPAKPCALVNGKTYYLNFVNADISHVLPGGKGYMTSTKTGTCVAGTYCVLPIYNGPRNF
jgi:hypothetical protein